MKNQYDALDSLIQSTHFANKKAKPAETFYEGKIGGVLQQFEKTEDGSYKRVARSMVSDRVARGHAEMMPLPKDAKIVTANTLETYASKLIGTSNDPANVRIDKSTLRGPTELSMARHRRILDLIFSNGYAPTQREIEMLAAYSETAGNDLVILHFKEGSSNKVWGWRARLGKAEIFWGKVGAKLGTQVVSLAKAKATQQAKLKKGYVQAGKAVRDTTAKSLSSSGGKYVATRRGSKTEAAFDSKPNALETYATAYAVKAGDNIRVGQTIMQQLGANKFLAMTGAKRFVWLEKGVQFDIPPSNKINRVSIKLNAQDEYDVEFGYMRGLDYKVIKKVDGVQASELQNTFTSATGLRTHL